jgi:hypothetical protein
MDEFRNVLASHKARIDELTSETQALQTLLVGLLLTARGALPPHAIDRAFDFAFETIEATANRAGALPYERDIALRAHKLLEEFRRLSGGGH